ncbi:MAG: 3-deoxy-D-manno-octulosonic acid transferase [Xanthobacteraceae bacterium]
MAERLPLTLRAYRLLMSAATPVASMVLSCRLRKGKEHAVRLPERRGEANIPRPAGRLIWFHGASVGEMNAIFPLIERVRAQNLNVLVTSGTVTSAGVAEKRLPPDVIHQFSPVDLPQFAARFLDHWKPDLGLFVESDLWPSMIMAASERNVPLILINGRLSERSFNRWRMIPRTIGALLRRFDLCLAQSTDDGARYAGLGAPRISTTGNLQLDVPAPAADADKLAALQDVLGTRPVITAASTHPGEETEIVDAHRRLKHSFPGLLTIIAPRHPERGQGIAEIAKVAGLTAVLRSQDQLPRASTDIYVADTLGELGLFYRVAPIVFVGGSLVSHGGQNPIEAIKLGAAVLHGPHVANFAEIYAALDEAGGAELVTDAGKLAVRIGAWLKDTEARKAVTEKAAKSMDTLTGALERTLAALDPYLMEFRLDRRADNA